MSFIEELKKRKVFRVAASYAVVAFIIFQLVEILFPIFNFPQWTQQFIVIIILLGFPIAIIFSWIFDKTPEGFIKTTKKNIKTDPGIIARRGMDSRSANILNETYSVYPRSLTVKILAKNLKIREKSVLSALRKISSYGVPIEIKINKNGEKEVKSSLKEPISWIEKEKASAEKMLSLLGELTPSSSESLNNQRKINYRIYKEYVSNLNELFDKWASLKLID